MKLGKKLSNILIISILLNWFHFLEVVITKFYLQESFLSNIAEQFNSVYSATYFSSHITLYVLLTLFIIVLINQKFTKYFLLGYSWLFISESHHFIEAVLNLKYYPGSITSFLYFVAGILYLKQLKNDWKSLR